MEPVVEPPVGVPISPRVPPKHVTTTLKEARIRSVQLCPVGVNEE